MDGHDGAAELAGGRRFLPADGLAEQGGACRGKDSVEPVNRQHAADPPGVRPF